MEKGILHIRNKRMHIRSKGKDIPIKKEMPEISKEFDKLECEFEGNPAINIMVGGVVFFADLAALEAKKEKAKEVEEYNNTYEEMLRRQENSGDSYSLRRARVPNDTMACMLEDGDNFSLKLNRFARYDFKDNKENEMHFKFFNSKPIESSRGNDKKVVVPAINIKTNFGDLFSINEPQLANRQAQSARLLFPKEGQLLSPKFKPDWRFVTGLGGHSVYETGITLHHVYGVPYIPASSIKGVLRSWVIFSEYENNEGKAISASTEFCEIFGCPAELTVEEGDRKKTYKSTFREERQGKVTFFDALPTHKPTIEVDIMNPHYPKYYSGNEAPTDTQSPTPIFFLTVSNTTFQFLLATKVENWNLKTKQFWDKTLEDWLIEALTEHGLGAKTAVGYGYMSKIP
ncbi:MAG: type III-B CRISPR module RAMP protein Cmr6 [Saprospiraceae bacterium]|nr:type III-B CRISPR module RAMP protein Cmr6 [Saprospiraceae bacterium]